MTGSTIGIDPSVVRPAFATWPNRRSWRLHIPGEGTARLHDLYKSTHNWTATHAAADLEAVFIERPVGRFPKRPLDNAVGVIVAAVLNALEGTYPHTPTIFELSPGEWKKAAGMKGNATKDDVAEWTRGKLIGAPPTERTQDEYDAIAIAAAGSLMLKAEAL